MAFLRQSSGVSKKKVECFYDVVSPYSWLGFEIICRYRSIWNLDLHLRPVFLSGIMNATGNQPPAMLPKRGEYLQKDVSQMGKYCQVPINLPKDFVNAMIVKGSLPAMRFITAVDIAEPQFLESVSRELWMRIWSRDEDIVQPESILAAFGVPCFVIQTDGKPQLFFGSDRVELLGNVLGEKWLGPVPTSSKL
ncbi:glutathione S-transferase kappa 1-like [Protobothrops mucrosquamatus]|uniref:glutathione S-transferase kappa 1-like n=1 Tax=Protobothrops mucrosquamatus TaxID=103944 RepID=UPI000775F45F|nr:glutathione S-transferase kappa 1-like [Protobothrops mucrosquamatus]